MPGLEEPQQHPAGEQLVVARDPAGREPHRRPAQENRRVKPARADPVGDEPRDDPPDRERQAEALVRAGRNPRWSTAAQPRISVFCCASAWRSMYMSMVASSSRPKIAQVRSATRSGRRPSVALESMSTIPGTAIPGDHPFQEGDDIMGEDAEERLALPAVARRGSPMWPGSLRSLVIQPCVAGSNGMAGETGSIALKSPTRWGARCRIIEVSHSQACPICCCTIVGSTWSGLPPKSQ